MNQLKLIVIISIFVFFSACSSVNPTPSPSVVISTVTPISSDKIVAPKKTKPIVPVAPKKPTVSVVPKKRINPSNLVGKYRLFAGSEISFDITQENGQLFLSTLGLREPMTKISNAAYTLKTGAKVDFQTSADGEYDRMITQSGGRPQQFIKEDSLNRSRNLIRNQSIYTQQLKRDLKAGTYTYSRFLSPSRGLVDYAVYLPKEWRTGSSKGYPLVFFLHGQTGWERSFPDSVPESQLNEWIQQGLIPPMVIVSLRTGRLNRNIEEQWSSSRNESLLTSEDPTELRTFVRQQFRAGMSAETTAIHGHSRGSRGAIHYALKYPLSFSSAVANAFVSDYALEETKLVALLNHQLILSQGIPLRISIGDQDEFALNLGRRASPEIHKYLNTLNIKHDYEVFPGINHGFVNLWNVRRSNGVINGLSELQFHANAWRENSL